MLEHENAFYLAHQTEFREKYFDKWLIIVGESLWGVYDRISDAAKDAFQHFEPGEFMIHKPADDDAVIEMGPFISVSRPGDKHDMKPEPVMIVPDGDIVVFPYA